jgi:DNA-binding response OmpR family regulator
MGKRILIVEDEQAISNLYRIALTNAGYLANTIKDGQKALDHLANPDNSYDLILLDIMLPTISGIKILEQIKQPSSPCLATPVILLTNLGLEELVKKGMQLGAEQYIVKSQIIPDSLADEINNFFNSQAAN